MSKPNLAGKAGKLSELVAYQADAVVSVSLLKQKTGNVTLFAFDQGQELSEHTTPHDALVQVLDGEVEIRISGKAHRLGAGEVIVMPADEPHALRATKRFMMLLTMVRS